MDLNWSESARRQSEKSKVSAQQSPAPRSQSAAPESPQAVRRTPAPQQNKSWLKRALIPLIIVVAIIIAGLAAWLLWPSEKTATTGIDTSRYQAVFFTNGQVYFGKLTNVDDEYMQLTDVFYLQTQSQDGEEAESENPQETTSSEGSNVQLIKLGNEIHGPEDAMMISKQQVLFFENLKTDGKVAQSIKTYQGSN